MGLNAVVSDVRPMFTDSAKGSCAQSAETECASTRWGDLRGLLEMCSLIMYSSGRLYSVRERIFINLSHFLLVKHNLESCTMVHLCLHDVSILSTMLCNTASCSIFSFNSEAILRATFISPAVIHRLVNTHIRTHTRTHARTHNTRHPLQRSLMERTYAPPRRTVVVHRVVPGFNPAQSTQASSSVFK